MNMFIFAYNFTVCLMSALFIENFSYYHYSNMMFFLKFLYSAYNLVPITKFDEIQIATTHSKRMINTKYKRIMIKQIKLNKTTFLDFL